MLGYGTSGEAEDKEEHVAHDEQLVNHRVALTGASACRNGCGLCTSRCGDVMIADGEGSLRAAETRGEDHEYDLPERDAGLSERACCAAGARSRATTTLSAAR
jgi:hypothetical protein